MQVDHELRRLVSDRRLVLASGSAARAAVLDEVGAEFLVDRPDVDERSWDHLLAEDGPAALALHLAGLKADAVAPRHPDALVVAADQVGVLDDDGSPLLLVQRASVDGAVAQLLAMSGTTHDLVNGLVVVDMRTGRRSSGIDVQTVTMARFDESMARRYVERFQPFESAGSYRIEDQAEMAPGERLLLGVTGEDERGVRGMPVPLLVRLLAGLVAGLDD